VVEKLGKDWSCQTGNNNNKGETIQWQKDKWQKEKQWCLKIEQQEQHRKPGAPEG
jgi:hypothetical protein